MKTYKLRRIRPLTERFWGKVERSNPDGCWEWKGCKTPLGYGHIGLGRRGEGNIIAHRLSWQISFGPIPNNMKVCHRCDNPKCVNPSHLFLGTQIQNLKDCKDKMRARGGSLKGQVNPNAKLTYNQVVEIRNRYLNGNIFQFELAREYGVTQAQISCIITGKSWSNQ